MGRGFDAVCADVGFVTSTVDRSDAGADDAVSVQDDDEDEDGDG